MITKSKSDFLKSQRVIIARVSALYETCGEIIDISFDCERLLGYSKKDLVGKKIEMLLPPEYESSHSQVMKQFSINMETKMINKIKKYYMRTKMGYYVRLYILVKVLPNLSANSVIQYITTFSECNEIVKIDKVRINTKKPSCTFIFNENNLLIGYSKHAIEQYDLSYTENDMDEMTYQSIFSFDDELDKQSISLHENGEIIKLDLHKLSAKLKGLDDYEEDEKSETHIKSKNLCWIRGKQKLYFKDQKSVGTVKMLYITICEITTNKEFKEIKKQLKLTSDETPFKKNSELRKESLKSEDQLLNNSKYNDENEDKSGDNLSVSVTSASMESDAKLAMNFKASLSDAGHKKTIFKFKIFIIACLIAVCGLASLEYGINLSKINESNTHYHIFSSLSRRYKNIFLQYSAFLDTLDLLYSMKGNAYIDSSTEYLSSNSLVAH